MLAGLTCAIALGLDLWSKQWAWDTLRPPGGPVDVVPPYLEFSFAFNTGGAFGLMREAELGAWFFVVLTLLAIAYPAVLIIRTRGPGSLRFISLGMIIAGALGNLHDRLVRVDALGREGVVDFIKINYPWGGSWPNFNVADIALVVGCLLLVIALWRLGERETPAAS